MKVLQLSGSFSQQTVWQYFDRPANGDVEYRRGGVKKNSTFKHYHAAYRKQWKMVIVTTEVEQLIPELWNGNILNELKLTIIRISMSRYY